MFSHRTSHCIPSHWTVEASCISERCRAAAPFHPDSQRKCSAPNRVAPRRQTPLHMISLQHRIARSPAPRPFHSKLPSAITCIRDGNTTHHLIAMALPCLRSQKFSVTSVLPSKNCLRPAVVRFFRASSAAAGMAKRGALFFCQSGSTFCTLAESGLDWRSPANFFPDSNSPANWRKLA